MLLGRAVDNQQNAEISSYIPDLIYNMPQEIKDGYTLTVIGCGVMGTAVTLSVLNSNMQPKPGKVVLCAAQNSSKKRLADAFAGHKVEIVVDANDRKEAAKQSDVILLGCKPYHFKTICSELGIDQNGKEWRGSGQSHDPLVISLLAGISFKDLVRMSPKAVRVMTNTPAQFGAGTAAVAFTEECKDKQFVMDLAGTVGSAMEIPEEKMDAATGLIGSGPAFCLLMMEALYDGGVRMGLPHDVAKLAAAQVMEGTGKMALDTGDHPAVLKSKVSTPGGTTIGGLLKLEDAGVRGAIARAVEEAANISASFSK